MSSECAFELCGFRCRWLNSITRVGYAKIEYDAAKCDFAEMYVLADRIAAFVREKCGPEVQFDFHYFEPPSQLPTLSVIPRFAGDYEDHNYVYTLSEQPEQAKVAQDEVAEEMAEGIRRALAE